MRVCCHCASLAREHGCAERVSSGLFLSEAVRLDCRVWRWKGAKRHEIVGFTRPVRQYVFECVREQKGAWCSFTYLEVTVYVTPRSSL